MKYIISIKDITDAPMASPSHPPIFAKKMKEKTLERECPFAMQKIHLHKNAENVS